MATTASRADDLIERIENGEIDPAAVNVDEFVEDDDLAMTPELWERLPEDTRERYTALAEARDHEVLAEKQRELTEEQREAVGHLEGIFGDEPATATVEVGSATLEVRTRLTGELERRIDHISKNRGDLMNAKENLIDAILQLVVDDDEPDDDPHTYTDRETWEAFYARNGTEGLGLAFEVIADPALTRLENTEKFRGQ